MAKAEVQKRLVLSLDEAETNIVEAALTEYFNICRVDKEHDVQQLLDTIRAAVND